MGITDNDTIDFLRSVQPQYSGMLGMIARENVINELPSISHETARLISVLLSIKKPDKILEIGCAAGFSAALMSSYLTDGGHLTTIDRYDAMIVQARRTFKRLDLDKKVTLMEGDALEILNILAGRGERYDVIFMDAAKGQYIQFLPLCLRMLNVGGLLIADDVLQEGRIARDRLDVPRRQRTIHTRLRNFLYTISNLDGLETCILPMSDGVCLSCKVKEISEESVNELIAASETEQESL